MCTSFRLTDPAVLPLAIQSVKFLRRFREVALTLDAGSPSLRDVAKKIAARPHGCGIATLCKLPNEPVFVRLLRAVFGRDVQLYRNAAQNGMPVMGLSDDGRELLHLINELLDMLDDPPAAERSKEARAPQSARAHSTGPTKSLYTAFRPESRQSGD